MSESLPPDDDIEALLPRRRSVPWGTIAVVVTVLAAAAGAFWLYSTMPQKGMAVRGNGHVAVLSNGQTWLFLLDGTLLRATDESAARLGLKTGPCDDLYGSLKQFELDVEVAKCRPGEPILRRVGERLQRMSLKFAYWDETLQNQGDSLEPHLATPEIVASMVDKRFEPDAPQLLPLYAPLFKESLAAARRGPLPPPVFIQVKRNDFHIRRLSRPDVAQLLDRERYVVGAAATKGGWVVRPVEIVADGAPPLERLLEAPEEAPWPKLLASPVVKATLHRRPAPKSPQNPPPPPDAGSR